MIRTHLHFIAHCDTPDCGRRGPAHNTEPTAGDAAVVQGWERRLASGTGWLYRCARCVQTGRTPEGWSEAKTEEELK